MTRLRHSETGYVRSLQMSSYRFFAFVEGKECDPFFFGSLCSAICQPLGVQYQIRLAKELPDSSGGKSSLLKFFKFLRKQSLLESLFGEKKTVVAFFLDKDIDDVLKRKSRSNHIIYTEHYDVQNYLYREAPLIQGLASSSSIDPMEIQANPCFSPDWCYQVADRWRTWVKLCIFSQQHSISCACNYRVTSKVNTPLNGPEDEKKVENLIADMASKYTGSSSEFHEALNKICRLVDSRYSSGQHDRVFKGKWYETLAELDLREAFNSRPFDCNGVAGRTSSVLAAMLDFNGAWAANLRDAVYLVASKAI